MRQKLAVFILLAALLLMPFSGSAGADTAFDLFSFLKVLDLEQCLLKSYICVPFGCPMPPPLPPFDLVCHNYPAGFVETTTAPFTTTVPFIGTLLGAVHNAVMATGGSGGSAQTSDTHLPFYEAHVFNLPTRTFIKLRYPFLKLCYWGSTPWEINYLSELDELSWRTGIGDYVSLQMLFGAIASITQICTITSLGSGVSTVTGGAVSLPSIPGIGVLSDVCMGTWGVTYPRTGWSNAESEVVASGISAFRASRIVSLPIGHVVLMPKLFSPDALMQLGYPFYAKPLNCFARGTTPLVWDNFDTKPPKGQGYIWVLWERKCCCFPPTGCAGLPHIM